jgi:hypothetical protein
MSFPYSAIVAANMLNKQGIRQANPAKIATLGEYTASTDLEVYEQLVEAAKTVGICEMADIISNWQNFDSLSDVKKRSFLHEYAPIGFIKNKPTLFELIKDLFNI